MRIHRELAAFALVHEEYEKSGSVINGLTPIFAPALAEQRGSLFSPAQFAKDVERLYDIPMTAIAAEGMAPKLRAAGLLIEEEDSAGTGIYRVARSIEVPDADLGEDVVGLLETFVEFASYELSRHGLSAGRDQIREVFLDVIKSQDFLLRIGSSQIDYYKSGRLSLNSSIESEESDTECNEDRLESAIYLLSAQYISSINRPESAQFATLNKLVTGALLAEVVMTLRVPSGVDSMDSTQIFIDTPLVLDLLDLSTPEHKSYAEQLFKVLNDASCKVFLFSHSLEEAKEAIRAPLSLLAGGTEPHGPLGFRLMHEPGHLAYTRTVLGSLAERITELGIAIYDSDEIATDKSYRAANLEERVLPYVGEMHYDVRPRLRDVQSISYTWYLRADYNPETLIDSRAVFVTRNAGLSRSVQRFFRRDDEFGEAIFPAIITDRELACLFWFIGGGDLRRITEARLVANCAAAVEPRLNIVSRMQQLLRDYDQEKLEQFQALMGDRRARACLTTETFGNAAALTIERAKEVYQQMIRVIAADKDQEMFERLRKERAKSAAEQARLREESVSKDTALDSLQKENNDLQIQVNAISEQHEREREKRITALRSYYQKKEHDLVVIARILILVTIVGLSAVSVLQVHILVSISVAVALSLIAHLFAPKFLRKRFSQPRARLLAFQRGAELGFSDREISEVLDSNEALNKAQF